MDVQFFADLFSVYLYFCGIASATGIVVGLIVKFWKYAHRQSDKNTVTLSEALEFLANDRARIDKLELGQRKLETLNTLQLETQIMLLDIVNVNSQNADQVSVMKEKIQSYLIKEGVSL